jgi:uncharacterized membrane protein YhfC
MDGLFIAHLVNSLLMIALPIGLAIFLTSRWKSGWRLWFIGAGTFILSQVGHIPFNALAGLLLNRTAPWLFTAVFLGLSAGLFEEFFRYGMFRWWAKDARSWRTGILTGAGHGGAEAILLGLLALNAFINLAALRNADLSTLFSDDQLVLARQQVTAYWSMSPYESLLGALERLFTIPMQISLAVIVLQGFVRGQGFWVWLAVAYHAVIDAVAVWALQSVGAFGTEAIVAGFSVLSLWIIFLLQRPEPEPVAVPPPADVRPIFTPKPVEETPEKLDHTRFE